MPEQAEPDSTARVGVREAALAAGIGAVAFLLVLGWRVLDPRNIGWLTAGDSPTQFIGWEFFRHAAWTLPLGANPDFGLDLGGSIVYSDSIPLLALAFKPFTAWLPEPFQYFGLWLLLCFVLQAFFAWRLVALFSGSRGVRAVTAAFFVMAPTLLWRISAPVSQWSLGGQFLITAGLFLAFDRRRQRPWPRWTLLLVVATAVHAYLLAMVAVLWAADAWRRRGERHSAGDSATALLVPLAAVFSTAWLLGYFTIGSGTAANGYGIFKATPWSLIDPGKASVSYWSRVLPDLRGDWGHVESFAFLGTGVLMLLLLAAPGAWATRAALTRASQDHAALLVGILGLAAFALSNRIGGFHRYVEIPLPESVSTLAAVFRASGRMLWPLVYLLMLSAIVLIARRFGKLAPAILLLALTLQLADTAIGWSPMRAVNDSRASTTWPVAVESPFWDKAALRYESVRSIFFVNHRAGWQKVAMFALDHGLSTDVVYLSRVSSSGWRAANASVEAALRSGCFPTRTMYIVDADQRARVERAIDPTRDLLRRIDGVLVLAPGWFQPHACTAGGGVRP